MTLISEVETAILVLTFHADGLFDLILAGVMISLVYEILSTRIHDSCWTVYCHRIFEKRILLDWTD